MVDWTESKEKAPPKIRRDHEYPTCTNPQRTVLQFGAPAALDPKRRAQATVFLDEQMGTGLLGAPTRLYNVGILEGEQCGAITGTLDEIEAVLARLVAAVQSLRHESAA
jgi:hypothetical protein